jgi:glycosyltransferase involved in cell wall biosynthesis
VGECDRSTLMTLLKKAAFLVFPSEYYENLPMVIIEAFACGTPVIASRLGSIEEIVQDRMNGLHFTPGDANHLVECVEIAHSNAQKLQAMRKSARLSYEKN